MITQIYLNVRTVILSFCSMKRSFHSQTLNITGTPLTVIIFSLFTFQDFHRKLTSWTICTPKIDLVCVSPQAAFLASCSSLQSQRWYNNMDTHAHEYTTLFLLLLLAKMFDQVTSILGLISTSFFFPQYLQQTHCQNSDSNLEPPYVHDKTDSAWGR